MSASYPAPFITRGGSLAGLSPRVAALVIEHEARQRDIDGLDIEATDEQLYAAMDRLAAVGQRLADLQPRSIAEASALLQCVFLDEHATLGKPGLYFRRQRDVLANVKAFLAAHVAAMPERTL